MVVAVGAIHMQTSARESAKIEQYCQLSAWTSLPGQSGGNTCDRDSIWAQLKVLGGLLAVMLGILLSWSLMLIKTRIEEAHVDAVRGPSP